MKVAIQTFKNSGHSGRGVGVYGEELVKGIKEIEGLKVIDGRKGVSETEGREGKEGVEVFEFGDVAEIPGDVDLVHFLVFDLFSRSLATSVKKPFVVTVHDVTPLVFPTHYPSGIRGKINLYFQKKALQKASRIITVSEASKKDIIHYLGIPEARIDVIYSGVSKAFKKISEKSTLEQVKKKYALPEKFAFYSGNVNWNKNILNMTKACLDAGLDLVIVGKSFTSRDTLDHPELSSFKTFLTLYEHHPKVHILGFVETEDMVAVLNQATVALFVSFYEGFGFPILEAQKCGVPVISSHVSSMPEVGGDGVLLVDPENVESIRLGIECIINQNSVASDLIKKGFLNVERFSWEKCAKETVIVYQNVLDTVKMKK